MKMNLWRWLFPYIKIAGYKIKIKLQDATVSEWSGGDRAQGWVLTAGTQEQDHSGTRFNAAALSHNNNTISTCYYHMSKFNHRINIWFLFSPSWCLSPCVLVWHILPHCPLEHFKSSYLLLQIWPMFFPSSFSSFVIHLLLQNPTFPRWSHSKHPSLTLRSPVPKQVLVSLNFHLEASHTAVIILHNEPLSWARLEDNLSLCPPLNILHFGQHPLGSIFKSGYSTTRPPQVTLNFIWRMHCLMLPAIYFLLNLSSMRPVHKTEAKTEFSQGSVRSNGNLRSVTTPHNSYAEMVQVSSRFLEIY